MKNEQFKKRMNASASDFVHGVKPSLEARLKCKIFSIEDLESTELVKKLDQSGIDAFRYDAQGYIRALASRMNYHKAAAINPIFTFRYARWNPSFRAWDCDREYIRKLLIARQPASFNLFPTMHVESFCQARNSGKIGWSYAASTKEILEFAEQNIGNRKIVEIFEPRDDEPRKVIKVSIAEFAKHHQVIEIPRAA